MDRTFFETASGEDLPGYLEGVEDINAVGEDGLAQLHWFAACNTNVDTLRGVLEAGGDVNGRSSSGFTALHAAAAYNGNADIVRLLLENKCSVNARNEHGLTPLHGAAAFNPNPEIIDVLLEADARIDSISSRSVTPMLSAAAFSSNAEVIRALAGKGADVGERNEDQETPLHLAAAFNKNPGICEVLIELGADVNAVGTDNMTPLHYAALNNADAAVILALLSKGADRSRKTSGGKSALDLTDDQQVRALLQPEEEVFHDTLDCREFGTNQYFADASPEDVMHCLASGKKADVVEKAQGLSYLSRAARYSGHSRVLKVMIEHGADVSSTDNNGNSALHWATKNRNAPREMVEVLLGKGANTSLRNRRNVLPVEMAARNTTDSEVLRILLEHGPAPEDGDSIVTLFRATIANAKYRKGHMQALMEMGMDINARDSLGNTILHQSVRSKNWPAGAIVPFLLGIGADPELMNNEGQKPIDIATKRHAKSLRDWIRTNATVETEGGEDVEENEPAEEDKTESVARKAASGKGVTGRKPVKPKTVARKPVITSIESLSTSREKTMPVIKPGLAKNWGSRKFFQNCTYGDVELCLERGSDPNKPRNARTVPLLNAARYANDAKIINLLIEWGADHAVRDKHGQTPMHFATQNEKIPEDVVRALASHGADVSVTTNQGLSPICTAARHATRASAIGGLIEAGASINDRLPRNAETLLHIALDNKISTEIINALLDAGLDINVQDESGNTALHVAVRQKKWNIVELLLRRGADPSVKNLKHNKPVDLCIKSKREFFNSLISEHGAEPDTSIEGDQDESAGKDES